MGRTNRQAVGLGLRAWLAGTITALAPLLFLEELYVLLRERLALPAYRPDWASLPISVALGVAATVWAGRHHWEVVPRWELAAQRVARHFLFLILSVYAVSKVVHTQFRVPYVVLDTPLGDVSGFMLAWRFFGYSHGHEWFVALGEFIGPALLLFWRTTTLGACITAVVLANVVAVNFTHDLPVQRFSSCLLALTVYLLLSDGKRLLDFFVLNQPASPRPRPAPLIQSRRLQAAAKAGWVALALGYSFVYITLGDSRPTPLAGAWTVESNDATPAMPWQTVYFERTWNDHYPGSIRRAAGARPEPFRYEIDPGSQHLRMSFLNPASANQNFDGTYEVEDGGRLRLRGVLGGQTAEIALVRKR